MVKAKTQKNCSVCYADELNAVSVLIHKGTSSKENIRSEIREKGGQIENELKKLGLCMNIKKTQIILAMNYQRRKPSCKSGVNSNQFQDKISVEIGGTAVEEAESMKTLGVIFDNNINFKLYWESLRVPTWRKMYGLSQIFSHLTLKHR